MKIAGSIVFVALGGISVFLHLGGFVFSTSGLVDLASPVHVVSAVAYLVLMSVNMIVLATLGHIGGTLVYGR